MCALYVVTIPSLSPYELETLVQTKCQEFTDVLDNYTLGTLTLQSSYCPSTSERSVIGPIYNISPPKLNIFEKYLDENLAFQISYCGTIFFIKKKDNSFHLVVYYQGLNKVTI